MIEAINKVLKSEDIVVEGDLKRMVSFRLLKGCHGVKEGFSVKFMFEDKVYTLELLGNAYDEESVNTGIYITKDGEFVANYIGE